MKIILWSALFILPVTICIADGTVEQLALLKTQLSHIAALPQIAVSSWKELKAATSSASPVFSC